MSAINIEVTKNFYDVTLEKGYYPLPGGGGDTSNLVPYTGATKNVNIGAYYFESSQGFKKTGGTANQALTANGDVFDLTTKLNKGTYTGTAQDLKNDIDNLQIGGRNYVLDSERERVFSAMEIGKLNGFTGGETITLSFEAKYVGVDVLSIQILNGGIEYGGTQLLRVNVSSPNYTKYSQTITLPASLDNLRLVGWLGSNGTGTGYSKKFKVEKGNKVTDWTPNPEDKQDRLQNISGSIGVGKTNNSATEKLDVNGNVKATGFKTTNGTSSQALTADGGVFDLNTKADIDDIPTKTSFTHNILVSNWTLVSEKYEAVISNAGILANSFVDVIPSNDHVDIVRNAQIYPSVLISAGSVKVYSKFLPSGTISVTVNVN